MTKLKIWLQVISTAGLLTGCASGPKYAEYKASLSAPPPGMGRIWFYRHSVLFGDAVEPSVKVDDVPVGHIDAGHFFEVETLPGLHQISTRTETKSSIFLSVSTNRDSFVQFYTVPGVFVGHVIPTEMEESDAIRGMQKMTLRK